MWCLVKSTRLKPHFDALVRWFSVLLIYHVSSSLWSRVCQTWSYCWWLKAKLATTHLNGSFIDQNNRIICSNKTWLPSSPSLTRDSNGRGVVVGVSVMSSSGAVMRKKSMCFGLEGWERALQKERDSSTSCCQIFSCCSRASSEDIRQSDHYYSWIRVSLRLQKNGTQVLVCGDIDLFHHQQWSLRVK